MSFHPLPVTQHPKGNYSLANIYLFKINDRNTQEGCEK